MNPGNFEFLKKNWADLSALGEMAGDYLFLDPSSALVKLRSFAELMVIEIYKLLALPKLVQPNLIDLLNNESFKSSVPPAVLTKIHALRINGNKAAHGEKIAYQTALWLYKEAFDLSKWFIVTFSGEQVKELPKFIEPTQSPLELQAASQSGIRNKVLINKLMAQEAQLQKILQEAEISRDTSNSGVMRGNAVEIANLGFTCSDELGFDENQTRFNLIDTMLIAAHWKVGRNKTSTDEVTQEEEIKYQPTETGIGYADYVLWDESHKPLAVIEAKKTAKSADEGRTQAKLYADGLEKMYHLRPIIFYTNGYDIWIWDDAQGYPPRKLYGFYSKDSLQYLVNYQRIYKKNLNTIEPSLVIANRLYQIEAIKRVSERFTDKHRKALLVQATGTGKTRVAISISDILIRANWVHRILFLCDRRELRKQAKNTFNDFINEPISVVNRHTANDRDKRIYLSTYPSMMKIFQTFDPGFFDLIIADESHRSIYNRYRDLFMYFDGLQIGLTATPKSIISHNTFKLFDCEEEMPTAYYPYEQAVEEKHLTPFEVFTHTTRFLREGIKYSQLNDDQKQQLEEEGEDPELFNYESVEIDKQIYNKDTNRAIIRNLMENGIREESNQHPGKSIIFARNHRHALLIQELFNKMYPQYGGKFCQVIDNYDPRAEQLIDDFKDKTNELTIAISVDMLDTGIDIPEIVNLVFAKPVKSKVKFWQMIGRGTRLCKDLLGPGKDKEIFRIFDHWENFEFFEEHYKEAKPTSSKSLMERVFDERVDLAENALKNSDIQVFEFAIKLIANDLASLPEESISVREKWKEKRLASRPETLNQFAPETVLVLKSEIAPLMQWVNINHFIAAYEFDLMIAVMQNALVKRTGHFPDLRDNFFNRISLLLMHLNPVREKAEIIKKVKTPEFWLKITPADLESVRNELRGIMQYSSPVDRPGVGPKIVDIQDGDVEYASRSTHIPAIDMRLYKRQVEEVLKQLVDHNPTLQKIKAGESVSEYDLKALTSLILTQNPDVDLNVLREFYPDTALPLEYLIRSIIGIDFETVKRRFQIFAHKHPSLNSRQTQFLALIQNHISKYGSIEIDRLYESPFTSIDAEGVDGVFEDESQIGDLIAVISTFKPKSKEDSTIQ